VVLVHGLGEHSGRYGHVAARLRAAGYGVWAIDHRGHGRSGGPRELVDRMDNVVADLGQVVDLASSALPERRPVMLGHSMGGTVALCYALRWQQRLRGLVLSGALAAIDAAPAPLRVVARVASRLAPRVGLLALDPGQVSRDPEVVRTYRADPLVHHGKTPARTLAELADAVERFPTAVGAIHLPVLVMYGTADGLCPPAGSVMLSQRLGGEVTVRPYEGLYHEIFNEPEREQVLDDLVAWLETH
jgi:acylglycerol lipase